MDWRSPSFALGLLAAAAAAFIAVSLYAQLGVLSVVGCVLMLVGFVAAQRGERVEWLGVSAGAAVAIGGLLFFVDNFLDPFALGLFSLAVLTFVAGGVALGVGFMFDTRIVNASGVAFLVAGLLWIIADAQSGGPEWQLGNALVFFGGLFLLLGKRRRPPRPTSADAPASSPHPVAVRS